MDHEQFPCPFLVVGVGNQFRGDDALGLIVARRIGAMAITGVDVVEGPPDGAYLIELLRGRECAFIVDAFASGSPPGFLHRHDATLQHLPAYLFRHSSHSFGVAEALELGRRLGLLPPRIFVYGIEGSDFRTGAGLSAAVEEKVDELTCLVATEIEDVRREMEHHDEMELG
jgi:hydrogenase maturation protease